MAKNKRITITNYPITSTDDDWGGVNETNTPISVNGQTVPPGYEWGREKEQIEYYIRQQIAAILAQQLSLREDKYEDVIYEDSRLKFYGSDATTPLKEIFLNGDVYVITLEDMGQTSFVVLVDDTETNITIRPTTKKGTISSSVLEDYTEENGYTYEIAVDNGNGVFLVKDTGHIDSGASRVINLKPWLTTIGTNRVRVNVTGSDSHYTKSQILTATVTSLSLTCSHEWQRPWNEGEDYAVTYIRFGGRMTKTLHIKLDDTEVQTVTYGENESASTRPVSVTIDKSKFPALEESGQHTLDIYMTGGGVETKHYTFNILCVLEGETKPLVCVNKVAEKVMNFATGELFQFVAINAQSLTGSILATLGSDIETYALDVDTIYDGINTVQSYFDMSSEYTGLGTLSFTIKAIGAEGAESDEVEFSTAFDNSLAYNAIAANKVFYMNAGSRDNSNADREYIRNIAVTPAETFQGTWSGMTWNTDGWTTDPDGHKALVIPAGCSVTFDSLKPFTKMSEDGNITIEMMIRSSVVADFDEPVISFTDTVRVGSENKTVGCLIYPTKIVLLGSDRQEVDLQSVGLREDTITHIAITLMKDYMAASLEGYVRNLATIYINGIPNVTFDFSGDTAFVGSSGGKLTIGQEATDTYLYVMRIYDNVLENDGIIANFLNAIFDGVEFSRAETRDDNNILAAIGPNGSLAISYDLAKDKYNCFVVEPDDPDAEIPYYYLGDKYSTVATVYFEYAEHHDWDVKITNVPVDGQGTTSKKYYHWNLRGKMKSCDWYYSNGNGTTRGEYNAEPTFSATKKGFLDGGPTGGVHSKIERWTAKKNVASSQQGHKIGATALYDDLFTQLGLKNELPDPDYRVAVWQYPFLGFRKKGDSYEFIGLYTIGPDKGCKVSFGYDADEYPVCMCIEGPNHAPRGTRFLHPWVDVSYSSEEETLMFDGQEAWDDDFSSVGDSADSGAATAILASYVSEWKPAYDLVYHCSPYIASLKEARITLDGVSVFVKDVAASSSDADIITYINENLNGDNTANNPGFLGSSTLVPETQGNETVYKERSNALMSFYDEAYDIWYLKMNISVSVGFVKLFRQDGDTQDGLWNIRTYLNLSGTPSTPQIIAARIAKFKTEMGNYFSIRQTLFHKDFCLLIGAKDNDAKNSYPFKHLRFSEGGRWGWKQDDLDSILNTDNNGLPTVKYSAEYGDKASGSDIFQGSNSAFWTIIWEYYQTGATGEDSLTTMMSEIMNALSALALSKGITTTTESPNLHDRVIKALEWYFFGQSAKYFPIAAYQEDRSYAYIEPWYLAGMPKGDGTYYDTTYNTGVYPLNQALGDRYQDERLWIERRVAYVMSKYMLGSFFGDTSGWGVTSFTIAEGSAFTFDITPAIDLYPTATVASANVPGERTPAGGHCPIRLGGDGVTSNYIKGMDWLSSIGDVSQLVLSSRGGADTTRFSITGKRLREVIVGGPDTVLFNAVGLAVSGAAIELVDARNTKSLGSTIDLRSCPRLKRALFGGSSATGLTLPQGSRVHEVSFPDNTGTLFLHTLDQLAPSYLTISAEAAASISKYYFYKCAQLNPVSILQTIASGNALTHVYMVWDGTIEATAAQVSALQAISACKTLSYQNGILNDDNNNPATVSGTIHVEVIDQDAYDTITAAFPNLTVLYDTIVNFIAFEDFRVKEICAYNWGDVTEGSGQVLTDDDNISDEIEGNGDEMVYGDYIFACTTAITAHQSSAATNKLISGIYVSNAGVETTSAAYYSSDFLDITGITKIKSSISIGNYRAFFDEDKAYVGNTSAAIGTSYQDVPAGSKYFRFSLNSAANLRSVKITGQKSDGTEVVIYQGVQTDLTMPSNITAHADEIFRVEVVADGTINDMIVRQSTSNTSTFTTLASDSEGTGTFTKTGNTWSVDVAATNTCQYLQVGLKMAAGTKATYKITALSATHRRPNGMSKAQAESVTSLSSNYDKYRQVFRLNTTFISLRDLSNILRYRTSTISSPNGSAWDLFSNNNNVEYADLHFVTRHFGYRTLANCPKLLDCGIVNAETVGDRSLEDCPNLQRLVFTRATSFGRILSVNNASIGRTYSLRFVLILSSSVPSLSYNTSFAYRTKPIYVQDDLIDDYKAATNWSSYSSVIRPRSQFKDDFPDDYVELSAKGLFSS